MIPRDPLQNILGRVPDLDKVSLVSLVGRLARERRLFHGLLQTLREGVLLIDAAGVIEYANSAARAMLGFDEKDVGRAVLWKQVPDLARTLKFTRTGTLVVESGISRELQLSYPESRTVRLYLMRFDEGEAGEEGGGVARHAVILSDITREKESTQQEIENQRVQSILQLSAGVAHELGNPLNSLHIHLQVMERQLRKAREASPALDKFRHSLEICSGEVSRLDSIITHFLAAVRPAHPDLSEVDLISVLEESLEFLAPEMESAGVRVDVSVDRTVPIVEADRNQLKQVLFNILKNARQAMRSGGTIKVAASSDDEFVFLRVADPGEGISDDELPRVFQPYFSTKQGGHGLGMMIVERIMRDHGGQVGIDSKKGVGTLVTLQFPQKHRRLRLLENRSAT
jgi:two-component system, sporulation sensor kinase E